MNEDESTHLPEEPEPSKPVYGIYPYHPLRRLWEYVMYYMSLLAIWECFYEWFFDYKLNFVWIIPALIIDLFFLADIFIVKRTGILHYGVIEVDKKSIDESISKFRLFIYWASPWPYYLIGLFLNDIIVFRVLISLKWIRLVRLFDARHVIKDTLIYINPFSKMAMLFTTLFTLVHCFACIFWFTGHIELPGESWLEQAEVVGKPEMIQYFHTVYYITTTILTIGYGDIHPYTFPEICVVIVIEAIGVFFYNFLVSNMVSIVADPSRNAFLSKYQRVYNAFKWRGVSDESMKELLRYYEYVWERDRDRSDFYDTAQKMPESLQKRIALTLHAEVFNKVAALRGAKEEMLTQIAMSLKPRIFTPGDFLIKAGRVSNKIFFVTEGRIDVLNPTGSFIASFDGANGCVLGESSVINGTEEVTCAIAETYVEAFELNKTDLESVQGLHERFATAGQHIGQPVDPNIRITP